MVHIKFYNYPHSPDCRVVSLAIRSLYITYQCVEEVMISRQYCFPHQPENFDLGPVYIHAVADFDGQRIQGSVGIIKRLYNMFVVLGNNHDKRRHLYPPEPDRSLIDISLEYLLQQLVPPFMSCVGTFPRLRPVLLESFRDLNTCLRNINSKLEAGNFYFGQHVTLIDLYLLPYITTLELMDGAYFQRLNGFRTWLQRMRIVPGYDLNADGLHYLSKDLYTT